MSLMPASAAIESRLSPALYPFAAFAWRLLLILALSRIALVAWQWERVEAAGMLWPILLQGLRFDLVLLGLGCVIPVLLWPVLATNGTLLPLWRFVIRIYFPSALCIVLFMELATPSFIQQFDFRPNILFVEYLDHPREVLATLWAAYRGPLLVGVCAALAFACLSVYQFARLALRITPVSASRALLLLPLLLLTCAAMIRSTTDHRPVNPSTVALSTDTLANELALNSSYTLLNAIFETREEAQGGYRYAYMSEADVVAEVRGAMDVDEVDFSSLELPTLHYQHAPHPGEPTRNLVIIIEESLGAEFVGSLGGLDLTPRLDELSRQGLWFSQMYATGTRSVRGLEALITGFTPTPARSVVKLPRSQRGFFTLAELLGEHGYESSFIYGGEAQFDNMRRFFMNNGFDWVIDEDDYDDPVFTGSWGVSDEDLFLRAHAEFSAQRDKPFFSVVFTSSNHTPFEYPDGRIELFDKEKQTVNNAVRYADYALGRFFDLAKQSDYWDDTVFLVVADHNSRVYGADIVPVDRFHIPALILGASITPADFSEVASQIDLAPTLLSLINVAAEHPMIGHDLSRPNAESATGRAIMQFNSKQAYMQGDQVVVLQKDMPARQFLYRNQHLEPQAGVEPALLRLAQAHSIWSSAAYENALYRLPVADQALAVSARQRWRE